MFPVTVEGPNYGQSIHPASITELSVNPVPVNTPNRELSVGLNSALKLDSELSVFPVPTNKPKCVLSACDPDFELVAGSVSISESVCEMPARSVVTGETVNELFMVLASVLETVNSMPVSCVSVFPRLQSLLWVPDPSWCSPDPSWCSPALSTPHWWAPALSDPPWRSPALSAPHWWAPALSALPWRSAVWLWWPSAPLWWSSASSAQVWWSSALPWWSSASSAQVWWSSALPWWSSAQVWWSSAPPWWSALPQCPISLFPHGPGPPSLPLFRHRSTALLDCIGASGSRSLWGGLCHKSVPWTSIHSPPEVTHSPHGLLHYTTVPIIHCTDDTLSCFHWSHSWLHNHTHFISLGLPLCHRRVLYSVYHSPSDSYSTEPT